MKLCNHLPDWDIEYFLQHLRLLIVLSQSVTSRATSIPTLSSWVRFSLCGASYNEIIQNTLISVWLLSLSICLWDSGINNVLTTLLYKIQFCECTIINLSILCWWAFKLFQIFPTMDKIALNVLVKIYQKTEALTFMGDELLIE